MAATAVPVVGDAREGLRALLPLLKHRSDASFLAKYAKATDSRRQDMTSLEDAQREPIAPQYLMGVVNEAAPTTRSSPATAPRSRPGPPGTGRSGAAGSSTCRATWATIATTLFKDKIQQLRS